MKAEKENNAKLSAADQKLISELEIGKDSEVVRNPFSGDEVLLEPKAVALHDFIKGSEVLIAQGNSKLIGNFDRARNIFRKLYPNAYSTLLD